MFRRLRPGKAAAVRSFRQNRRRWWCDRYGLGGRLRRRLFLLAPALLAGARRNTKLRQGFFRFVRLGGRRFVADARRSDQDEQKHASQTFQTNAKIGKRSGWERACTYV